MNDGPIVYRRDHPITILKRERNAIAESQYLDAMAIAEKAGFVFYMGQNGKNNGEYFLVAPRRYDECKILFLTGRRKILTPSTPKWPVLENIEWETFNLCDLVTEAIRVIKARKWK